MSAKKKATRTRAANAAHDGIGESTPRPAAPDARKPRTTKPRATRTSRPRASSALYPDLPVALPRTTPEQRARAERLLLALRAHYPDAHCELTHSSAHELLVATILSAQCTDVAVNKATPALFARFPTPAAYAQATPAEIEPYIRSLGFFRNKAKSIHGAMTLLVEKFNGEVPRTMDELLTLPGVARKTAGVVLGNIFKINDGVVVDTHVERLSKRLGLARPSDAPADVENRLMSLFPRESWCDLSHMLIFHGRRACKARHVPCGKHPICAEFRVRCNNERWDGEAGAGASQAT